jgi:hypothetical protein
VSRAWDIIPWLIFISLPNWDNNVLIDSIYKNNFWAITNLSLHLELQSSHFVSSKTFCAKQQSSSHELNIAELSVLPKASLTKTVIIPGSVPITSGTDTVNVFV